MPHFNEDVKASMPPASINCESIFAKGKRKLVRRLFRSVMNELLTMVPDIPFCVIELSRALRLSAGSAVSWGCLDKLIHQHSMFKSPSNACTAP